MAIKTNREFLTAISTANVSDEVKAFAMAELEKLDARNAKRRNTPTKEQEANEAIKLDILAVLAEKKKTVASVMGTELGITTSKASALLGQLVKAEKLTVADVKVKGKGTVKEYTLVE